MFMTDIAIAQKRSRRYILASIKTIQDTVSRLDYLLEENDNRLV